MNRRKAMRLILMLAGGLLLAGTAWGAEGHQLWETPLSFLPQRNDVYVFNMAVSNNSLVVVGVASDRSGANGQIFFVETYDIATGASQGEHLINDTLNFPGRDQIFINGMAATSDRLVVVGVAVDSNSVNKMIGFIQAFDLATGAPKWQYLNDVGNDYNFIGYLVVDGNVILVNAGSWTYDTTNKIYTLMKYSVQAYNADTGGQLWEAPKDFEWNAFGNTEGVNMTVANNRIFLLNGQLDTSGLHTGNYFVRAYQEKTITPPLTLLLEDK